MDKYQVLYIDEDPDFREIFKKFLPNDFFDVVAIHPYTSEEEMINYIINEKFNAVIIDYGLMQKDSSIKYNGGDLLKKINDRKEGYPVFILTRDIEQDGGIDEQVNPTMILLKDDINTDKLLESMKRIITKFIKLYYKQNSELSQQYLDLKRQRDIEGANFDIKNLELLNELDQKIEKRMLGSRSFPNILKDSDRAIHLNNLIKEAEEFLEKNIKQK